MHEHVESIFLYDRMDRNGNTFFLQSCIGKYLVFFFKDEIVKTCSIQKAKKTQECFSESPGMKGHQNIYKS